MTITNIILILVVLIIAGYLVFYIIKRKKTAEVEQTVDTQDDKTYTIEMMTEFVKKRLDEITKINLYDIGLSEEEKKVLSQALTKLNTFLQKYF